MENFLQTEIENTVPNFPLPIKIFFCLLLVNRDMVGCFYV